MVKGIGFMPHAEGNLKESLAKKLMERGIILRLAITATSCSIILSHLNQRI